MFVFLQNLQSFRSFRLGEGPKSSNKRSSQVKEIYTSLRWFILWTKIYKLVFT